MTGQNVWLARSLAGERWNRKNEVADAALRSSGESESRVSKKGKFLAEE
jgi:hypothetical protein